MSFTKGAGRFRNAPALTLGSLALVAMLVVAVPAAMGAADPLKGGATVLNLKVKVSKASGGATKTGKNQATLPITGGTLDPTTGVGSVENGGKVKIKKGSETTTLSQIVAGFGGGKLSAKVGKKTVNLATIKGGSVGRAGFGGTVTGATAKLTKKGAKALNKALDTSSFKKGKKLAGANTVTEPSKVTVKSATSLTTEAVASPAACVPAQNCPYAVKVALNALTVTASDGAVLDVSVPTAPKLSFTPQTGGSIAPDCSDGSLTGSQGKITFDDTLLGGTNVLSQATPEDQFGNKVVSFEAASTLVGTPSNPASLGRAPATNLDLSGATCTADPANHKITITNVVQTVGLAASSIANQTFGLTDQGPCTGAKPANECPLKGGDLIGTTSWDITTQ